LDAWEIDEIEDAPSPRSQRQEVVFARRSRGPFRARRPFAEDGAGCDDRQDTPDEDRDQPEE
jgi:hypothetical protein